MTFNARPYRLGEARQCRGRGEIAPEKAADLMRIRYAVRPAVRAVLNPGRYAKTCQYMSCESGYTLRTPAVGIFKQFQELVTPLLLTLLSQCIFLTIFADSFIVINGLL